MIASRRWSRALPVLALLTVIAVCAWIGMRADDEVAVRAPATCRAVGCYCETTAMTGIRQPINAWSSLAPALAGVLVLLSTLAATPRGRYPLARSRIPGIALGAAACAIAVFSFHYHATLTWLGEWLDGVALYLIAGFPIAWVAVRAMRRGGPSFAVVYGAMAAVPALASWMVPAARKPAFLLIAAAGIAVVLLNRKSTAGAGDRWLVLALLSFGIALVAWILDATRTVCAPGSWMQLHSLWHLLSVPTIVALERYAAAQRAS